MNLKGDHLLAQNLVKAPEKDQEVRIESKGKTCQMMCHQLIVRNLLVCISQLQLFLLETCLPDMYMFIIIVYRKPRIRCFTTVALQVGISM